MTIAEAFELAESVHTLIIDESTHDVNFLRLECVGTDDGHGIWAASFDTLQTTDEDWFETTNIERYKYSARASSPAEAIERAANKVLTDAEKLKGSLADYEFNPAIFEAKGGH